MGRIMHKNRYGDTMSFELVEKDVVIWRGSKSNETIGVNEVGTIIMVDPSGGPHLESGSRLDWLCADQDGNEFQHLVIDHFMDHEEGYIIMCNIDTTKFFEGRAM